MPQLPDVEPLQNGSPDLKGYELLNWFGLFTTAGTPREVIGKINAEVRALFAEQAFLDRAIVPGMFETMVSSPEQFAEFIKSDSAKWSKVLREANIIAD
jgi:tripartite-type tricarboxylate transporter receptor subunit TctC